MRLLFDENLSHRLVQLLDDLFPGSAHVRGQGVLGAPDHQIWFYAQSGGFVIVSKDTDFQDRSLLTGAPPKVVWLDVGNSGTSAIHWLLRQEHQRLMRFERDPEATILHLTLGPERPHRQ